MNQKELLFISVGVFLTIIAWIIIDVYHVKNRENTPYEMTRVERVRFQIDENIFKILEERN